MPFGLEAQVALDVILELLPECCLVGALDGPDVGVGAAEQHVVEHRFAGARPGHRLVELVDVGLERSPDNGDQALFEPAGYLLADVLLKALAELALVRVSDRGDLEGVLVGQDPDERLLVRAESLHGVATGGRVGAAVPLDDLRWAIAQSRWGGYGTVRLGRRCTILARRGRRVRSGRSGRRLSVWYWGRHAILSWRRSAIMLLAVRRSGRAVHLLRRRRLLVPISALLRRVLALLRRRVLSVSLRRRVLSLRRGILPLGRRILALWRRSTGVVALVRRRRIVTLRRRVLALLRGVLLLAVALRRRRFWNKQSAPTNNENERLGKENSRP
jgi:hypothetical protein